MTRAELANRHLNVMVTKSAYNKLSKLAEANGRSLSAEARFALSKWTEKK